MIIVLSLVLLTLYVVWRFFFLRDPQRTIPSVIENKILAPSDGYVIYTKRINKGDVPIAIKNKTTIPLSEINETDQYMAQSGVLIGVFLTAFSVHRLRAPFMGKVNLYHHRKNHLNQSMITPLINLILKRETTQEGEYFLTNERLTLGIQGNDCMVFFTAIADKWINRIDAWIRMGEDVKAGQQLGIIRFGSQCDIFIPDDARATVEVNIGDYIYAGETVIATTKNEGV